MSNELSVLKTADELFARPEIAHIITMDNPNQNLHLERMPAGFRFTAGSPKAEQRTSREFSSLESLYEYWLEMPPLVPNLRGAIWQDITDYPVFSDAVLYQPLHIPVELSIPTNSEQVTAHGPHMIYGPVDITLSAHQTYHITATSGWLVIAHPAWTFRGGVRGVLRPTRNILDRWRLKRENDRLPHEEAAPQVRPGGIVVYGKPPKDWRTVGQSVGANHPAPTA